MAHTNLQRADHSGLLMIEPWQEELLRQLFDPDDIAELLRRNPNGLEELWAKLGQQLQLELQDPPSPKGS